MSRLLSKTTPTALLAAMHSVAGALLALLLVASFAAQPVFADGSSETGAGTSSEASPAEAAGARVVRVGFPIQEGFTEIAPDGGYSGYTYEYLEQISQYTGWNYEFVTVEGSINDQLTELLAQLEAGEIDMLGAMSYNESLAEVYDFAIKPYGNAHTALFASDGDKAITDTNIYRLDRIVVATNGPSPNSTAELKTFCEMNGIDLEILECESIDAQIEAVIQGQADLALGVDISPMEGFHVVASFTAKPFYFATTKGNHDIVSQLNEAITSIDNAEPQLENDLHRKYFGSDAYVYGLSPEMYAYIEEKGAVRIGYTEGDAPIQDTNSETGELEGATRSVLEHMEDYTGLAFEAVPIPEGMGLQEAIEKLDLDAVSGVLHDFGYAHDNGFSLSSPYLKSQTWIVARNGIGTTDLDGKTLALTPDRLVKFGTEENVVVLDTLEDCIAAVDEGRADYTLADGYTAPFFMNIDRYRSITALPDSTSESNICFAFPSSPDPMFLQIMNKAIEVMPTGAANASIYQEVTNSQKPSVERFVKDYAVEIIILCLIVAVIIVTLSVLYARARSKAAQAMKAEKDILKIRADQDDLTGLLGVGAFREQAGALIARGEAGAFAVIDIDDFKRVNDTLGHRKGDDTLIGLAMAIRRTFRGEDVIGRFGGDEFAVCVKGAIPEEALEARCSELIGRVRDASIELESDFSVSIGATIAVEGDRYAELYERADKAMYTAKQNGKHGYVVA